MNSLRLVLFLLIAQLPVPPQSVRTGTASVEGIVVRLGTSEPIAGVDMELTDTAPQQTPIPPAGATPATALAAATAQPPAPAPFTAKSGNDGRFVFRNLPSGAYKLVAARIGGSYVPVEYGQRGVLGRGVVFPLGDGDQKKDIRLEMAPVGTITGRVIDENARPVGHAAVLALTPMYRDGQEVFNVAQIVHTNDHGEYRLFSLVPGKYYVAARPEDPTRRTAVLNVVPPGRRGPFEQAVSPVVIRKILPTGETVEETFRFVYYGGSTEVRRATSLTLTPGANLGAIDIPLAAGKTRALHVRGKVVDSSVGGPAKGANVRLIPRAFSAHMIVPQVPTDANGEFDLVGVVPGSYELYVMGAQVQQRAATPGAPPPPPLPPLINMMPIEIGNDDVNGLSISINIGSVITGRITVEGPQPDTQTLTRIRVNLQPFPTGVAMVQPVGGPVTAEGNFRVENIWPAQYRVSPAGIPPASYVKSIRMGTTELLGQTLAFPLQTDTPIEIVVAADVAGVDGRVLNDRGEGTSNVKVALVPDAPLRSRLDLYRNVATDASGNFRLTNVAPGDYKIFAWEVAEDGAWTEPEFLRTDEGRGKAVRVTSQRSDSLSLTVIKR